MNVELNVLAFLLASPLAGGLVLALIGHHDNARDVNVGFSLCTFVAACVLTVQIVNGGPMLVWADEFDGPKIDYTKWAVEENAHGGGNNELQYFVDRPENVRIEDGHLVVEARKEAFNLAGQTRQFTSGRLRTTPASITVARWQPLRI